MGNHAYSRRAFIRNSSILAALSGLERFPYIDHNDLPARRVALIGTGWYGKSDLLRLCQIARIEVVGLCDVDRHQLSDAETLIKDRLKLNRNIFLNMNILLMEKIIIKPPIFLKVATD